jgi:hypothetical protein
MKPLQVLLSFLLLAIGSRAQFQFFDQMFGQQQRAQPQEPQNVASDSKWYRETYMNGMSYSTQADKSSNSDHHMLP